MSEQRKQLLALLAELSEAEPEQQLGQLIANLARWLWAPKRKPSRTRRIKIC
jgi:hypothetical protein